jgi:type III secretion system low calcium response chaperone LcrH/SycD
MKGEQQQIKKAAGDIGTSANTKDDKDLEAAVRRATRKGSTAKDALGLTDAMVEGIYGQAYRLYNTGKYKDAIQLFRLLIMLNTTEPKYVIGLAACFHMQKEYKSAVDIYSMVSVIDPQSPLPFYHASDCYMQMGDPLSASIALELAIKRAADKPEFKALKERATLTIESLKKQIAQSQNKS